jgi:cytochrome c peroxidase
MGIKMATRSAFIGLGLSLIVAVVGIAWAIWPNDAWTDEQSDVLRDLWIGSLGSVPDDPSNAHGDDDAAVELGHKLFFDTRLSSNGQVACATCHQPDRAFTDGMPLAHGVGTTDRKTPTIIGTAFSPWQFWDGRADSQWAQALGPLESPVEHGGTRTLYAHVIAEFYQDEYDALFGPLPDLSDLDRFPPHAGPHGHREARTAWDEMASEDRDLVTEIYVNMGKAIAAYERQIIPGPSRFDMFVEALLEDDREGMANVLSPDEIAGLRLFIGKGECIECHSGPLMTNNDFHNIGVPARTGEQPDPGRANGSRDVLASEFNCLSPHSDATDDDCAELRFLKVDAHELEGAFKTPTLRMIGERAPYMHAGQFQTLEEVVEHYNKAPEAVIGHSELTPLGLTSQEIDQLVAFLRSLDGSVDATSQLLVPPAR